MAKKSKSKKKAKEVDPEEKERLDLLERAVALRGEADKEKALETQFQAQSESLKQFWEMDKKLREDRQRHLRSCGRSLSCGSNRSEGLASVVSTSVLRNGHCVARC